MCPSMCPIQQLVQIKDQQNFDSPTSPETSFRPFPWLVPQSSPETPSETIRVLPPDPIYTVQSRYNTSMDPFISSGEK